MYTFCIIFQYFLQKKSITKHWTRPGVDATMVTDYLCQDIMICQNVSPII